MGLLSKVMRNPTIGGMLFKIMKKKAFKPYRVSPEKIHEKQSVMLERKFGRMEATEIGKKLGVCKGVKLQNLPIIDYGFYETFFSNPTPSAFMYPLKDYVRTKTSGTAGKEKWFLIPREEIKKSFFETALGVLFSVFHDGEKSTLEYGDTLYVNTAPRPFAGGFLVSEAQGTSVINVVPNVNLPYHDKVRYFILNHKKVDGALMLASTLISKIIPEIEEPIKLKGILLFDSITADVYKREIEEFTGVSPKTCYYSTETFVCSIPSVQYPLGFMLDWRRGLFEFLRVKEKEIEMEPIEIDQVEVGETYQLVFTSFISELTRYNKKDSLKCIAIGDDILGVDCPIFKFQSRLEKTISLQDFTRISENELIETFENAKIPFSDFTARVVMEKGLEYLLIYLEHVGKLTAEDIQRAVHDQLYETDRDYKDLVDFFGYIPVKIRLLPKGTFAKYLEEKIATVPKVDRVNMEERELHKILKLIKEP